MEKFKYNIGDFVSPVVMNGYEQTKMVVTARVTTEYAQHTERYYLCGKYSLGNYERQGFIESEIVSWEQAQNKPVS